ncbi:MAG: hypothetical protein B7X58_06050 [Marinobacter sp. 34-60-7]|nr:MAG: hypothetical protein B7X58_06050 [Marinobacter sp. 34-60-7]
MEWLSSPEHGIFDRAVRGGVVGLRYIDSFKRYDIVLDFAGLEYLDSAALGILLVLNDRAKEHQQTVTIRHARGVVREILDVAHFDRMFTIED